MQVAPSAGNAALKASLITGIRVWAVSQSKSLIAIGKCRTAGPTNKSGIVLGNSTPAGMGATFPPFS